jgi:hypothetical protein
MAGVTSTTIKSGDEVLLNRRAMEWTWGLKFKVDSVRPWGIVCHWEPGPGELPPPGVHAAKDTGWCYYPARWEMIEGPWREQPLHS